MNYEYLRLFFLHQFVHQRQSYLRGKLKCIHKSASSCYESLPSCASLRKYFLLVASNIITVSTLQYRKYLENTNGCQKNEQKPTESVEFNKFWTEFDSNHLKLILVSEWMKTNRYLKRQKKKIESEEANQKKNRKKKIFKFFRLPWLEEKKRREKRRLIKRWIAKCEKKKHTRLPNVSCVVPNKWSIKCECIY